ncbi:MAG: carbohydrate ABC transporter permease [Spirochaetia bacterium]|nr:carbohydrate ABC transporter permease [Spirochaetia bacterium]MCF7940059.1 carbohydrate ABC transporter permease [Spirochaetia bacterium]
MKADRVVRRILFYVLISIIAMAAIIPFLWMLSTSFKAREAIHTIPIRWIPKEPSVEAYTQIFKLSNVNFVRSIFNSFYVSIMLTIIPLLTSAMAAFAFAKLEFKGKHALFSVFLFTMMLPGTITMIPNFITLKTLGLLNSYSALLLPALCNAFAIFFIRQNMMRISNIYIEAAVIDGASLYRIFWTLMLPLTKPVLFTMGLFNFMGAWNSFLWPLIVLSNRNKWTLQLGLGNMGTQFGNYQHYLMAGSLISIVPIVIVYIIAQKYVEEGLATGGLKG